MASTKMFSIHKLLNVVLLNSPRLFTSKLMIIVFTIILDHLCFMAIYKTFLYHTNIITTTSNSTVVVVASSSSISISSS